MRVWVKALSLLVSISSPLLAQPDVQLQGSFTQGSLIKGQTAPGTEVFFNDKPLPVSPDGQFVFGAEFLGGVNRTGLEAHILKARLDGELTDNLDWSTTLLYGDYDKYYGNLYPRAAATKASPSAPASATTIPGLVQNCPAPIVSDPAQPLAIAAPRAARAEGSRKTGFTDPNSP